MNPRKVCLLCPWLWLIAAAPAWASPSWFGIQAVDAETGRGIPLIELRTVHETRWITDNAGWIAFLEPGLMEREVWFHVSGPGYTMPQDGFGFTGVRLVPQAGQSATIKLTRTNVAERVGRLTGQGLYRDSELLGLPCPLPNLNPAGVLGQDSVNAAPYRGNLFWLWGDTNLAHYPLGNFRVTCATTARDADPERGLAFDYFLDPEKPGQPRKMMPLDAPGAVWLFGLLTVEDEHGEEALLAHYGRHLGLQPPEEHGIARYNDARGVFESVLALDKAETWRFPRGDATRSGDWYYFAHPFLHTRVRATLQDVTTPNRYEALCYDKEAKAWKWQRERPPTLQQDEASAVDPSRRRYDLRDASTGETVRIHRASIHWNAWRKRWVLLGVQEGGKSAPSYLGEVWYAESDAPDGPWRRAIQVASHPHYSFYNPVHHPFFDAEGGRVIYFEGTYTREFSGNPMATPRYDYNQLLYRLDLSDPRLEAAR